MPCLLPADCLNEIFEYEYLEKDTATLYSCLLVNRLWCKVSVEILWRDIWNVSSRNNRLRVAPSILSRLIAWCEVSVGTLWNFSSRNNRLRVAPSILSTLIACLPNESKELLHENKIFISTPTSKSPIFNYAAFCKVLSISEIVQITDDVLRSEQHYFTSYSLNDKIWLVAKEILKMFMDQISTLKKLDYCYNLYNMSIQDNISSFIHFPGARDCLTDLSELHCSNLRSNIFYQLSRICHNIQSLTIKFNDCIYFSYECKEFISSQNNLNNLIILAQNRCSWAEIITSLAKNRNTLVKLQLYSNDFDSLIDVFFLEMLSDFGNLFNFPKLQTLKLPGQCPKLGYVIKFLEINGENLKELYMNSDLSLHIAKFCPNLERLFVLFKNGELDELKTIFNNCQQLESIEIWCGRGFLSEREALEIVANHSPKNFYELKIFNNTNSILLPDDLESFFINWKNRIPKKLLSLIIIKNYYTHYCSLVENEANMTIIKKYRNLVVIKFGMNNGSMLCNISF